MAEAQSQIPPSIDTQNKTTRLDKFKRNTVALAKGVRDFGPADMRIRAKTFAIVEAVFQQHGASQIDTPVFDNSKKPCLDGMVKTINLCMTLMTKMANSFLCATNPLTVPFARYLAMNNLKRFKRYHIAKVYRRDDPAMARGRFREFYQCDFDIAGDYTTRLPDAECLSMISEILTRLEMLYHRRRATVSSSMGSLNSAVSPTTKGDHL